MAPPHLIPFDPPSRTVPMRQHVVLSWMIPLFLLPLRPAEQGIVVAGRVTDENMQPIGAVSVTGARVGTVTDSAGHYTLSLPRLNRGDSVVLVARRIGYRPAEQRIVATRDTMRVNFTLAANATRLESVVLSGAETSAQRRMSRAQGDVAAPAPVTFTAPGLVYGAAAAATVMEAERPRLR